MNIIELEGNFKKVTSNTVINEFIEEKLKPIFDSFDNLTFYKKELIDEAKYRYMWSISGFPNFKFYLSNNGTYYQISYGYTTDARLANNTDPIFSRSELRCINELGSYYLKLITFVKNNALLGLSMLLRQETFTGAVFIDPFHGSSNYLISPNRSNVSLFVYKDTPQGESSTVSVLNVTQPIYNETNKILFRKAYYQTGEYFENMATNFYILANVTFREDSIMGQQILIDGIKYTRISIYSVFFKEDNADEDNVTLGVASFSDTDNITPTIGSVNTIIEDEGGE
jgi:hypothetical protein